MLLQAGWEPVAAQGASLGVGVTLAVGVAVAVAVGVGVGVGVAVAVAVGVGVGVAVAVAVGVGVGVPLRQRGKHKPCCHWLRRCSREQPCRCSICGCRSSIRWCRRRHKQRHPCHHCNRVIADRLRAPTTHTIALFVPSVVVTQGDPVRFDSRSRRTLSSGDSWQ